VPQRQFHELPDLRQLLVTAANIIVADFTQPVILIAAWLCVLKKCAEKYVYRVKTE